MNEEIKNTELEALETSEDTDLEIYSNDYDSYESEGSGKTIALVVAGAAAIAGGVYLAKKLFKKYKAKKSEKEMEEEVIDVEVEEEEVIDVEVEEEEVIDKNSKK